MTPLTAHDLLDAMRREFPDLPKLPERPEPAATPSLRARILRRLRTR